MAGYLGSGGGYYGYHPTYPNSTPNPTAPPPVAPAPAPAAPAPPPAAAPPAAPWVYVDPVYEATAAGLGRDQALTQGSLAYQRNSLEQQYGFNDTSNPFSQAAMLTRAYQQNQRRTLNSAGDDLYSSSYTRNQDTNRYNFEQQTDAARRALADAEFANTQAGTAANNTYTTGTQVGKATSIQNMPAAGEPNGPPIPPAPPEAPAAGAAPATNPYVRGAAGTATNNTAVAALGPKGAVQATGQGGGSWNVQFSDGRWETVKFDGGWAYVYRNGSWTKWTQV